MSSFHSSSRFALHCNIVYSCRLLESLLETKAFCLFPIKAFVVYSVPPPHSQISRQEFLLWPPWAQKQSTCSQTEHFLISHFSLSFNLFSNVIYVFVGLKQVRARWGETFHIFFFLRNFISLLFEKRGALCKGAYSPKPSFLDLLLSFQEFPLLSSMHTKSNPPENTLNTNEWMPKNVLLYFGKFLPAGTAATWKAGKYW